MLPNPPDIVSRLREFQRIVRDTLIRSRQSADLHEVSHATSADTIYRIDTEVEPLLEAFCKEWARKHPIVLVAEGLLDESGNEVEWRVFPEGAKQEQAPIRLIVDPIDGTRGIMYDKRPAWTLAGAAPNKGAATRLRDIEVAVMTELPTSKMGYADVLWAIKGQGAHGVRESLTNGEAQPLKITPSTSNGIDHGFAGVSNFFPGTKVLAARLMEYLVSELIGAADVTRATVFDDQYISTGGQFYELIVGHDRFNCDLRPLFYQMQNQPTGLCCHPYDCATALIAEEAGVILTDGLGNPLDGPLNTTTPLAWAGYANAALHDRIQPLLTRFLRSAESGV